MLLWRCVRRPLCLVPCWQHLHPTCPHQRGGLCREMLGRGRIWRIQHVPALDAGPRATKLPQADLPPCAFPPPDLSQQPDLHTRVQALKAEVRCPARVLRPRARLCRHPLVCCVPGRGGQQCRPTATGFTHGAAERRTRPASATRRSTAAQLCVCGRAPAPRRLPGLKPRQARSKWTGDTKPATPTKDSKGEPPTNLIVHCHQSTPSAHARSPSLCGARVEANVWACWSVDFRSRHPLEPGTMPDNKELPTSLWDGFVRWGLAAGSASFAETSTFPLVVLAARQQLLQDGGKFSEAQVQAQGSVFRLGRVILRDEGVQALYSGVTPSIVRQAVYGGLGIGMYPFMRRALLGADTDPADAPIYLRMAAAASTGAFGQLVGNPIDVVRVRMATAGASESKGSGPDPYRSTWSTVRTLWSKGGAAAFYAGVVPSVTRAAAINGCGIASYDHSKQAVIKLLGREDGLGPQVLGASISGLVSATVSTPFDVVKSASPAIARGGLAAVPAAYPPVPPTPPSQLD